MSAVYSVWACASIARRCRSRPKGRSCGGRSRKWRRAATSSFCAQHPRWTYVLPCSYHPDHSNDIARWNSLYYRSSSAINSQASSLREVFPAKAKGTKIRQTDDFTLTSGQCDRNGPPCGHCADAGVPCVARTISLTSASDETDPDLEQLRLVPGEG